MPNSENQKSLVQESMRRTIRSLLNQGHTVVLVYPIPEVGWDVPTEMWRRATGNDQSLLRDLEIPAIIKATILPGVTLWPFEKAVEPVWPLNAPVTTSYDVYVNRTQSTFDALDSITSDRIIRIYPHKIFCDERDGGRCVTHDDNTIFYQDSNHLLASGALLLTAEIMKEISQWDPKP